MAGPHFHGSRVTWVGSGTGRRKFQGERSKWGEEGHSCRPRACLDAGEWSDSREKGMDSEPETGGYSEKGGR